MDIEGFGEFLKDRGLSKSEIEGSFVIVEHYETYLRIGERTKTLEDSSSEDVQVYSGSMIQQGLNSYENYLALARYGLFIENNALYLGVLELLDGAEALDNLFLKLGETLGEAKRDDVFEGIERSPLGSLNDEKPKVMSAAISRLENQVDPETCKKILGSGLRNLKDDWYQGEKQKFEECGSIDEYLIRKGDDFIDQLEDLKAQNRLFFNQAITDEVIAYVDRVPEIRQGVRRGNTIFEVKIPHMAIEYLAETDEDKKRYYYCHCPWVKESLKSKEVNISPIFCNCSAAFHKKPWEVIFEQSLEAEIVESVLMGDLWCKIAISLPKHATTDS
jgi:hypothetical protein